MFCSKLLIVILKYGLNEIEELAFHYCESLQRIIIPNTVKTIRYGAFQYCSGLVTVSLNDGLEEIEAYAFDIVTRYFHPQHGQDYKLWGLQWLLWANNCFVKDLRRLGRGHSQIAHRFIASSFSTLLN